MRDIVAFRPRRNERVEQSQNGEYGSAGNNGCSQPILGGSLNRRASALEKNDSHSQPGHKMPVLLATEHGVQGQHERDFGNRVQPA